MSAAAYGGLTLAEIAACDFELQYAPVVKVVGLTSEYSCLLFAVTARAWQLGYPVDVLYFADYAFLVPAAHAELTLAVVAVFDLEFPDGFAVEKMGPISECLRPVFVVTQNVEYHAADYPFQVLFVFPVELAFLVLLAPDNVAALRDLAADNGNFSGEVHVAVLIAGGTDPRNTVAGILVAVRAVEQNGDPICPNRFYADSNPGPSDHPNAAVRHDAIRESTQEVEGSNAQGFLE